MRGWSVDPAACLIQLTRLSPGEGIPCVSSGDDQQTPEPCAGLPRRVRGHEVHRDQEGVRAHQDGGELPECDQAELYHRVGS